MSLNKDATIEIGQVANGFIVRPAGPWFGNDHHERVWTGASGDYLVFRTMVELQQFLADHFSHRAAPKMSDLMPPVAKTEKKAA